MEQYGWTEYDEETVKRDKTVDSMHRLILSIWYVSSKDRNE